MTRTFTVTPEKLRDLSAYLRGHGLNLDPSAPQGEAIQNGWDVQWTIQGDQMTVTVAKHPFAAEGIFWNRLDSLLK